MPGPAINDSNSSEEVLYIYTLGMLRLSNKDLLKFNVINAHETCLPQQLIFLRCVLNRYIHACY